MNIDNLKDSQKSFGFRDTQELRWGVRIMSKKELNSRGNPKELIDCKVYRSRRGNTMSAGLWVYNHGSGAGKAGGYGYDKESAAISSAFYDAGITLERDELFSAVGRDAALTALKRLGCLVSGGGVFEVEYYA